MRTIDKILYPLNLRYGAPMGMPSVGTKDDAVGHIYDCKVPMSSCGAYARNGAYFGAGRTLRVQYDKQLNYVRFYRMGDTLD